MTIECPFCGMDNAYCDGLEYVCPDCDSTWPCEEIPNNDDYDRDYLCLGDPLEAFNLLA